MYVNIADMSEQNSEIESKICKTNEMNELTNEIQCSIYTIHLAIWNCCRELNIRSAGSMAESN